MSAPAYACRDIVDVVTEYLEGGLAAAERLAFERHVAICPPCRGYLAQLRRVVEIAPAALEREELPPTLREGLIRVFDEYQPGRAS